MSKINLKQCDKACLGCVTSYKKKYGNNKNFSIGCSGIPLEYVPKSVLATLSDRDAQSAIAIRDPVTWAANILDWHCIDAEGEVWKRKSADGTLPQGTPNYWDDTDLGERKIAEERSPFHRPYQAEMLRCLQGDTTVFMSDGTVKPIKDIEVGDQVVTYNENRKSKQRSYRVVNKWQNGIKDIYKVTLDNGDELKVTSNHPILSWFKSGAQNELFDCKSSYKRTYTSIDDGLSIGDRVYTLNNFDIFGEVSDKKLARLLGYIATDGFVKNSGLTGKKHVLEFRNIRREYVEEFQSLVSEVFEEYSEIKYYPTCTINGVNHQEHWGISFCNRNSKILSFLRRIGCTEKSNRELSILNFAFKFNETSLAEFINRSWAGIGCVYLREEEHLNSKRATLTLSSGNEEFLRLYRILLKKIGILTSKVYTDNKPNGYSVNHILTINQICDIETFFRFCGPIFGKEEKSIEAISATSERFHSQQRRKFNTLSRTKITSIEHIGQEPVYDIEVETRHNFIADGVVVHNCTSKRKVFRIGRQCGKCLSKGTLINLANGQMVPVENLGNSASVVAVNDDYRMVPAQALIQSNGIKDIYLLRLSDGRNIAVTDNHPFLTRTRIGRETTGLCRAIFTDEWKETKDLTTDDYVAIPRRMPEGSERITGEGIKKLELLGLMIADGDLTSNNCRFSNTNSIILNKLHEVVDLFGCQLKQYPSDSESDYHVLGQGVGKKHPIKEWFKKIGLYGLDSHQKFLPDFVMTLDNKSLSPMLAAMYGCDGWASVDKNGRPEIGYCTASEKLAKQLVNILARFGIYSRMNHKKARLGNQVFWAWQVTINRAADIQLFCEQIGILGKDEQVRRVNKASLERNISHKTEAYQDNDVVFVRVKDVIYQGKEETYDLSVPGHKNFVAENIISHNTEALIIAMLHAIYTNRNFSVVLLAPYQAQISMIFKRIRQHIDLNPVLFNSKLRLVQAPHFELELYNGSRIRGFTAGTSSKNEAAQARGQSANMLVFDEADYLAPGDVASVLATIINNPTATLWMSSTPTGKREKFYEACNNPLYKEFHYPSMINPNWNDEMEAHFRAEYTEIEYTHEVLAEFGEQVEGVFQVQYVEAAMEDYQYGTHHRDSRWQYCIGVDWNDTAVGTTIVVTGWNPDKQRFEVVDRHIVGRDGWTQTKSINKIIELNRRWLPEYIYIDKGYGSTQDEILRLKGHEALIKHGPSFIDSRLAKIVKAYDFGSNLEIIDPMTKQRIKKKAKPFLVENAVRKFEAVSPVGTPAVVFPESDDMLKEELLGYIIDRVTQTGVPVYKQGNELAGDHLLDAFMLSLVAFQLEFTQFGVLRYDSHVAFSGQFGEKLTPPLYEGEQVIGQDPKYQRKQAAIERKKDYKDRTETFAQNNSIFNQSEEKQLPAANTTRTPTTTRYWSWPGFMRDKPHPSLNRKKARKHQKPKRKKF